MKLFDFENYCFRDVVSPVPENCFLIQTQDEINQISASITGGGKVWIDESKLKWTGKSPSEYHTWNGTEWVLDEEKKAELINAKRQELINNIDDIASTITDKWTRFIAEYEEREKAAKAFSASNYQGEPSIWITAFSHSAGLDNKTATQLILKQAEQLRTLQAQLGALRMRKYELKQPDLTIEQMQSIYADITEKMKKLAEAQQ